MDFVDFDFRPTGTEVTDRITSPVRSLAVVFVYFVFYIFILFAMYSGKCQFCTLLACLVVLLAADVCFAQSWRERKVWLDIFGDRFRFDWSQPTPLTRIP